METPEVVKKIRSTGRVMKIRREDGYNLSTARLSRVINTADASARISSTGVLAISAATELLLFKLLEEIKTDPKLSTLITPQDVRTGLDNNPALASIVPCIIDKTHHKVRVVLNSMGKTIKKKIAKRLSLIDDGPKNILNKIEFI